MDLNEMRKKFREKKVQKGNNNVPSSSLVESDYVYVDKKENKTKKEVFEKNTSWRLSNNVSNYDNSSVFSIVKSIIVDKLGVEPYEVVESSSFIDDLDADSLDAVELIMECEMKFGISIPDERIEEIHTVGDAVELIEEII